MHKYCLSSSYSPLSILYRSVDWVSSELESFSIIKGILEMRNIYVLEPWDLILTLLLTHYSVSLSPFYNKEDKLIVSEGPSCPEIL